MPNLKITERIQLSGQDLQIPYIEQVGFDNFTSALDLHEHQHAGFEFTYVEEGTVVWELGNGSSLKLKGREMALTQPGIKHRGEFDSISPASIFWVSFVFDETTEYWNFSADEVKGIKAQYSSLGNSTYYAGQRLPVRCR